MEKTLNIKRRRPASLEKRKARAGYVFVLPFILGIVLIYLPILLDSLWFSFYNMQPGKYGTYKYVFKGFEYYRFAFTGSKDFVGNLLSGLQQLIFEVPAVIIFSLFVAVVLNQKMLGRAAFRAIFFVPVIISTGLMDSINGSDRVSSEMSGGIDDGSNQTGIISAMQVEELFRDMAIGGQLVGKVVDLVNNIYNIINYSGVQMLIFLAGLQSISDSIYEASRIDGATGWETFWKITFPMISPMILVNAVYTIIDSFTRSSNITMKYIKTVSETGPASAMYWIYFISVILIIAAVAGVASTFIFYQRKD
ncbi:MAG: sugar ABC transporter permease [Clostridia bacterium]|jgi:ABC-type sugar transport system permease subunit|nr:sugar ABC transporter permease [Clostridia bacterium]